MTGYVRTQRFFSVAITCLNEIHTHIHDELLFVDF